MPDTLLVPMELDALVANNQLVARDTFRWWTFNYNALDKYKCPEPLAFNQFITGQNTGVYLHWTLPRSLRSGQTGATIGSDASYPLMPNRWLIARLSRTSSQPLTAWILESDCPTSPSTDKSVIANTSAYLINPAILAMWQSSADSNRKNANVSSADASNPMYVNLGIPFDQNTWSERAAPTMFLTAVAAGNAEFSAYVAHNMNIFSFYDALTSIDKDTVSYFVTGWYSDITKDIVVPGSSGFTGGATVDDVLNILEWTMANNASPVSVNKSLYTGMIFSLDWDRTGSPPGDDPNKNISPDPLQTIRQTKKINVAIGNTTIDAFSTLLGQQLAGYEDADRTIALLRAFQYDLLPLLNDINGDALLEEKLRAAWFNSKPGGTRWAIVADSAAGDSKPDLQNADLTPTEAAWLLQLNIDQKALDDEMAILYSLQWALHAAWWKRGHVQYLFPNQTGYTAASFDPLFDTTKNDSLLSLVLAQLQKINGMLANVPQPIETPNVNSQDAFLNGIAAFAQKKNISAGKILKALSQPRYWKANNPVVVISGVEPSSASDPDASLTVRLTSQVINGFNVGGNPVNAGVLGKVLPVLTNTQAMPDAIPALFLEFFLLDPGNASVIAPLINQTPDMVKTVMTGHKAADYQGTLPDTSLDSWSQPWNPMYLEWKVNYTYIPYATNGNLNWIFDGTDYILAPNAVADTKTAQIGGISLLSPHAQFVFGARLKKFIDTYGDQKELQQLYDWIGIVDDWKFLAQELVNFGDMLTQRDGRAFRRPGVEAINYNNTALSLADVMGFPGGTSGTPYSTPPTGQGLVNNVPFILNDVNVDFHGVCQGQIYFTDLIVYDKFGRILNIILSSSSSGLYDAKNFPLIRDAALYINQNMTPSIAAPAQLPPRLLQHARLDMLLVDQMDDSKILNLNADVNPICGWMIPNHLDQGLLLYASDGTSVGELRLIQPVTGAKQVKWSQPPHSALTLDQINTLAPHVYAFINAAQGRGETEFQALLSAIDSTLWTIDPLGSRNDQNLSVLVGRPLALVRTKLQLSLDGQPISDVGWKSTFTPPAPDFLNTFSVRFGDQATREDGVIGYFIEKNYGQFNSVVAPLTGQTYVTQIGPLGNANGNYINLQVNDQSIVNVTLLVDPRASIHATTGILPVKELTIPARFIEDPLANMEIAFHVGPLLTRILPTSTAAGQTPAFSNSVDYLPIAEQNGTWSWWEKVIADSNAQPPVDTWQGYDLAKALPNAELKGISSTLREGLLQLVADFKNNK